MNRRHTRLIALALILALVAMVPFLPRLFPAVMQRIRGLATIDDRLAQYGDVARARLAPAFEHAQVPYPPPYLTLLGLKQERELHLYAGRSPGELRFIRAYPILGASGDPGPKLREGDSQVPEGVYEVESLNPNSLYHLSLRLSYPSDLDRARAAADGRTNLGGDIMIHGRRASVGCLAMGDPAAEELFTLAADTGLGNITVILAPADPRTTDPLPGGDAPPGWLPQLHAEIKEAVAGLPLPPR